MYIHRDCCCYRLVRQNWWKVIVTCYAFETHIHLGRVPHPALGPPAGQPWTRLRVMVLNIFRHPTSMFNLIVMPKNTKLLTLCKCLECLVLSVWTCCTMYLARITLTVPEVVGTENRVIFNLSFLLHQSNIA